ncbi:MAG: hypothetical protein M0R33_03950 [Methylomonas sp.]|uniref:hypothetical protein n=1 Tax=Methylomonas sp. TaxID=418 RepID=UPI0025FEF97C|nr:hypothetical protein [Methylomonas sp.]MCK9605587.1 hypothetical protein [Methylomonas sp.]
MARNGWNSLKQIILGDDFTISLLGQSYSQALANPKETIKVFISLCGVFTGK